MPNKVIKGRASDQLYHHGILGMKWGIRRYQNQDGTRTAAGKKRYDKDPDKQKNVSEDAKSAKRSSTSDIDSLSNEELRRLIERTRLEEEYARLNPQKVNRGKGIVKGALERAGEQALQEVSKGLMIGASKLIIKSLAPEVSALGFGVKESKSKKKGD